VGDDERRPPGDEASQAEVDAPLGPDVDRGRRLVEDEDPRIREERARERDELPLAEREAEAALADVGVVPVRERFDEAVRAHGLGCPLDVGARGVGPAERDVVRDRPAEQEPFLGHDPELPADRRLRHLAQVGAVDRDPPGARVVEAREQLRDGRLARPGVAHQRHCRPGGNVEVEVVEDVGQLAVAEADVVEVDVTVDVPELARVRGVDDVRLLVQHDRDPVERRGRGEEGVVELRELLDGIEEVREEEQEGDERARRHVPLDDEPAAEPEHDRGGEGREDVDGREVDAVQDDRLVVGLAVALVDAAEVRLAGRLARERLDDAHPGDVLRERRGHQPEALADAAVRMVRARPEPRGREAHEREDHEGRQRETPVEEEENDHGAREEERVLHEARDAVGDQLVERLHVVGDPADDRARAVALVVAEREALEMPEELDPEVCESPLADPARVVGLCGRKPEDRERRHEERDDDERDRLQRAVVDAVVDHDLGEERRHERNAGERDERDHGEDRPEPIGAGEPEQRPQASARPAPRPVVDPRATLVGEVAAELPDLHPATTCCSRPCSWISRKTGLVSSSSACVPRAVIRPWSRTTISSASAIVESRWAMMIVVRPRITSRSPARIFASVVASTDAVASSRIRIRGSMRSARAIAIRWRCPPESVIPRSPTTVS
jgi:hypothetical protein